MVFFDRNEYFKGYIMFFFIIIEIYLLQNENKIGIVIYVKKKFDGVKQIFMFIDINYLFCDFQREVMVL